MYSVYRLVNLVNNKCYIGITKYNAETRFKQHLRCALNKKTTSKSYLYAAIRKYGKEVWEVETLFEGLDKSVEIKKEIEFIALHRKYCKDGCYNITAGGEGMLNVPHTEEFKEKARINALDLNVHELYHPEHGMVKGTQYQFKKKYGLTVELSRVISGKKFSLHGWRLGKNKNVIPNTMRASRIYECDTEGNLLKVLKNAEEASSSASTSTVRRSAKSGNMITSDGYTYFYEDKFLALRDKFMGDSQIGVLR